MMAGRLIAIANMKGGVGKTTTTVSMAETFAAKGAKVLIVDLDAQANSSYCVAGSAILEELISDGRTIDAYFEENLTSKKKNGTDYFIRRNVSNVTHLAEQLQISLFASSPYLRAAERQIIVDLTERRYGWHAIEGRVTKLLQDDLAALRESYDVIIFDCAPGISAFTEVAIRLSDLVITPTIPDFLSTLGLSAFCGNLFGANRRSSSNMPVHRNKPWVLPTRVRLHTIEHQEKLDEMFEVSQREDAPYFLFDARMHETISVPIALQRVDTNGTTYQSKWGIFVDSLNNLCDEIQEKIWSEPNANSI
jgi:cellulose biosynthesis protein BcsQ